MTRTKPSIRVSIIEKKQKKKRKTNPLDPHITQNTLPPTKLEYDIGSGRHTTTTI